MTSQRLSGARGLGPRLDAILCWWWLEDGRAWHVEVTRVDAPCDTWHHTLPPGDSATLLFGRDRLVLSHLACGDRHVLHASHPVTRTEAFWGPVAEHRPCDAAIPAVAPDPLAITTETA